MFNITADGGVRKRILREGIGNPPSPGNLVSFHFVGQVIADEEKDTFVFDQTYQREEEFSFTIGQEQTIEGLELAVSTMKVGEKAIVEIVDPKYAYGPSGNPQGFHGCGLAIPPHAKLRFELDICDFEPSEKQPLWNMSVNEKLKLAQQKKQNGNLFFQKSYIYCASSQYKFGLKLVDSLLEEAKDVTTEDEKKQAKELKVLLQNNLASCYLKNSQFQKAVQCSNQVLEIEKENTKALFRRGKANMALKNHDEAYADLQLVMSRTSSKNDPSTFQILQRDIAWLKQQIAKENAQGKQFFGRAFQGLSKESLYPEHSPSQAQTQHNSEEMKGKRHCNICDQEVDAVQWARHIIKYHS